MKNFLKANLGWLLVIIYLLWYMYELERDIPQQPNNNYQELIHDLDSLNSKLDSLLLERDSLTQVIDSSKANVEYINKWYEKTLIDITNQSIASDVVFFTEYISKTDKGFVNSNNATAVKSN